MSSAIAFQKTIILTAIGAPIVSFAMIAALSFFRRPWRETWVGRAAQAGLLVSLAMLLIAALVRVGMGSAPTTISLGGGWITGGVFAFDLLVDGWALSFSLLCVAICGVVATFSIRYLHLEPGFDRYFMLLVAFVTGLLLISFAGSIEVLYAGWEILGLSSALLVAFFHEREAPVTSGLRVFAFYRVGDVAMLAAAVLLHHWAGSDSLVLLFASTGAHETLRPENATVIAVLLIIAASAKSALFPFSSWLPRAMEGPTPSTAVYYGALSIHAGCFLLFRAAPLLDHSTTAKILAIVVGAVTALYAALLARVQTDVKSKLCFASLTQVGIIVVEIAVGLRLLAFLHICGNACYRLLQFLSAPNLLHDLHQLESDLGGRIAHAQPAWVARPGFYLFALERGFLDGMIDRFLVGTVSRVAGFLDRLDRRLCSALPGLGEDLDGD